MSTATEPLHLQRWKIQHFRKITILSGEPNGQHTTVRAKNGRGKTSWIEALWALFKGFSKTHCPEPIKLGANQAYISGDFGEFIVERFFEQGKETKLVVTLANGKRVRAGQDFLDGFMDAISRDPIAFLKMKPAAQVEHLLKVVGVAPPVGEVLTITGESHPPKSDESASAYLERLSADETGLYYHRRREANRVVTSKAKARDEQAMALEQLGGPLRPEEAEGSATELLGKIDALQAKAEQRRAVYDDAQAARRLHGEKVAKLERVKVDHEAKLLEGEELLRQMSALRARQEALSAELDDLGSLIEAGLEAVPEYDRKAKAAEDAFAALPDPAPQIHQLREQVRTIEQTNAQRSKRLNAAEQLRRFAEEHKQAEKEHKALDVVLEKLRDLRLHLLDDVDLGVPGLAIGDGELRLNGVSFKQAGTAEGLTIACALAFRSPTRLKIMCIDDGEHLDSDSQALLHRLADAAGWQCLMTCVSNDNELQIVEGKAA